MKSVLIIILFLLNYATNLYSAIPRWNPCIRAKNTSTFRRLNISSQDMEACFQSAINLVENRKTLNRGIDLFSRFLYIKDDDYRIGAILQLANTLSPNAIPPLVKKGKDAINKNNATDLEFIVTALVTLNAHTASRELASYAKSRRRLSMMRVIGNEYLVYTSNRNFERMEKIVGPILE